MFIEIYEQFRNNKGNFKQILKHLHDFTMLFDRLEGCF